MSRRLVTRKEEIILNVLYFWEMGFDPSTGRLNHDAASMLRRGRNLVAAEFQDGPVLFAPSRFAGYVRNTFEAHERDAEKDGKLTDPAISGALGPFENRRLSTWKKHERRYNESCSRFGTGRTIGTRDFWTLRDKRQLQALAPHVAALLGGKIGLDSSSAGPRRNSPAAGPSRFESGADPLGRRRTFKRSST